MYISLIIVGKCTMLFTPETGKGLIISRPLVAIIGHNYAKPNTQFNTNQMLNILNPINSSNHPLRRTESWITRKNNLSEQSRVPTNSAHIILCGCYEESKLSHIDGTQVY